MPEQRWHIGTVGFAYDDWRGSVFYPPSVKPGEQLAFYAKHFDSVEIDSTFHATPPRVRFERWADATPDGFRFALKTPKAVTHEALLADALEPMQAFLRSARGLGDKLGVVLIQYPPTLPAHTWSQVARFLDALPDDVRYAVEFRHRDWFNDRVFHGLAQRRIALVNAEYDIEPRVPTATADFTFLRLIGRHGAYEPLNVERVDPTPRLTWWRDEVAKLTQVRDVWCMLNNDYVGFAIATADRMKRLVGQPVASREERLGVLF